MSAPAQMTDHALDFLKGWHDIHAVDYVAKMAAAVEFTVPNGRVVSLNADGYFVPGLITTRAMGMFLQRGGASFDVNNPGGTEWYPVNPGGDCSALVACQGYELESTEYDTDDTYLPNTCLTSDYSLSDTDAGLLKAGTKYTHNICGVVSRGERTNAHRKGVIAFWTVYLPATT